jgi:hypothetical protein
MWIFPPNVLLVIPLIGLPLGQVVPLGETPAFCVDVVAGAEGAAPGAVCASGELVLAESSEFRLQLGSVRTVHITSAAAM